MREKESEKETDRQTDRQTDRDRDDYIHKENRDRDDYIHKEICKVNIVQNSICPRVHEDIQRLLTFRGFGFDSRVDGRGCCCCCYPGGIFPGGFETRSASQ